MADMVTIRVEEQKLLDGIKQFAKETGQSLKAVYEDQMRLASNSLVRAFPPKKQAIGRKAVIGDLMRIFVETNPSTLESWDIVGGNMQGTAIRLKSGAVYGVDKAHTNTSGDLQFMKWHHMKNRMPSNGRTTMAGIKDKRIGRWRFVDRQHVPPGAIMKYARAEIFGRVGLLKSGWLMPPASGIMNKVPAWVKRAQSNAGTRSDYSDQMDLFASGFLKLTNNIPYAPRQDGLVKIELQKRQRDLKKYAGKRLDREVSKFNQGRV